MVGFSGYLALTAQPDPMPCSAWRCTPLDSQPQGGWRWLCAGLLALALTCAGCGPRSTAGEDALAALERLCFVPPGRALLQGYAEVEVPEALLAGRFEITRGEWIQVFGRPPDDTGFVSDAAVTTAERHDWPAFCSHDEAQRFAAAVGMRLPTLAEWVYLAGGSSASIYPWGRRVRLGLANSTELGLGRPTAVGTFEGGRSFAGCYDLFGNVAEWVERPQPGDQPMGEPLTYVSQAWALGGGYLSTLWPLHQLDFASDAGVRFCARVLDGSQRSPDLGARLVVAARPWLVERALLLEQASNARARLRAAGAEFGSLALPLLEDLVRDHPRAPALRWLLEGARP
jgi:Sulfatase-modifying factor enzyme 1